MSRSKRKNPFCGMTTSESEKEDKRIYNRRFRHKIKQEIHTSSTDDDFDNTVLREVSNPWSMDKDGRQRFDPKKNPEEMRK